MWANEGMAVLAEDDKTIEGHVKVLARALKRGALLPLANTTAELLARHIGRKLLDFLQSHAGQRPQRLRVEVDENFGQWAVCEFADR